MLRTRVIPSLLIRNSGLIKTFRFKNAKYVGDPINAIKIFNDKEVDELVVLDVEATKRKKINFEMLGQINKEAFIPLGYGGGIKTVDDVKKILQLGYEKVIINTAAIDNPKFVTECAKECGSQSVVCCIDSKRSVFGKYYAYDYRIKRPTNKRVLDLARQYESLGCGELLIYSVDNDGMYSGYDLKLIKEVTSNVQIPVVALGGAANIEDFKLAVNNGGASAVAAGSMFVFHGPHKAVLISYPSKQSLKYLFNGE